MMCEKKVLASNHWKRKVKAITDSDEEAITNVEERTTFWKNVDKHRQASAIICQRNSYSLNKNRGQKQRTKTKSRKKKKKMFEIPKGYKTCNL